MNDKEYTDAIINSFVNSIINRLDTTLSFDQDHGLLSFDDIFNEQFNGPLRRDHPRHSFNFYPSSHYGSCQALAMFTSLNGKRWRIKSNCKLNFEQMFKFVIKHCQGLCPDHTKTVALIVDNWDDDVVTFWQSNIDVIKATGVNFELRHITGSKVQASQL